MTLDFKSTSKDGIIFYAADNDTNPAQYVSLELVNGRLEFKFSLGATSLKISTTNDYADGNWHLVCNILSFDLTSQSNTKNKHLV